MQQSVSKKCFINVYIMAVCRNRQIGHVVFEELSDYCGFLNWLFGYATVCIKKSASSEAAPEPPCPIMKYRIYHMYSDRQA